MFQKISCTHSVLELTSCAWVSSKEALHTPGPRNDTVHRLFSEQYPAHTLSFKHTAEHGCTLKDTPHTGGPSKAHMRMAVLEEVTCA
jgi:hypothetical protein